MPASLLLDGNYSVDMMKMVRSSLGTIRNMLECGIATEETRTQIQQLEQLEQLLLDQAARLDAINRVLEEFNYSVAHELFAPLRRITGFTQEIKRRCAGEMDINGMQTLDSILESTEHMNTLIEALMQLSRLSHVELQFETVDLSVMTRTIAEELIQDAPQREVSFTIAPQLSVTGDASLLRIAMRNLLENAWKFTALTEDAVIELGEVEEDSGRVFYIRDNGVGFDMAHYGRLFHPFQRLHDAVGLTGNGIGLTAVRRIIERHGGRIWATG